MTRELTLDAPATGMTVTQTELDGANHKMDGDGAWVAWHHIEDEQDATANLIDDKSGAVGQPDWSSWRTRSNEQVRRQCEPEWEVALARRFESSRHGKLHSKHVREECYGHVCFHAVE
jgi:hypothetical protein